MVPAGGGYFSTGPRGACEGLNEVTFASTCVREGHGTSVRHADALPRSTARDNGVFVVFCFFLQAATSSSSSATDSAPRGVGTCERKQQQQQRWETAAPPLASKTFRASRCVDFHKRRKGGKACCGRCEDSSGVLREQPGLHSSVQGGCKLRCCC